MERRRLVVGNCYDYPQYYDVAPPGYTKREADFIEAACRKYCLFEAHRLLEPACGAGRLITELAARGYELVGFDLSQQALTYLRRRLARHRFHAETFKADMSDFRLSRSIDAAYCTVNTFRHLLTEQAARGHLECIARSLRVGGIYVLGLHLLSSHVQEENTRRWTQQRGKRKVTVTRRVVRPRLCRRVEDRRVCLLVRHGSNEVRLRHEFQLRTYTVSQFRRLLASVPSLELCDVYDFRCEIQHPAALNSEMAYGVFVLRRFRHHSHYRRMESFSFRSMPLPHRRYSAKVVSRVAQNDP
jgi:SAM-dependent methyltransferase